MCACASCGADGTIRRFRTRTWNATVANLTLMALGSSAPEILLSVIELLGNKWHTGDLGPSTIVGSAAFNLFVIIAVCVVAIPADDSRKIAQPRVYAVTAFFSVFAYIWLVFVLLVSTPEIVDLFEAILTFLFFPIVVWIAYVVDKWTTDPKFKNKWSRRLGLADAGSLAQAEVLPTSLLLDVKNPDGSPVSGEELLLMIKVRRRRRRFRRSLGCAPGPWPHARPWCPLGRSRLPAPVPDPALAPALAPAFAPAPIPARARAGAPKPSVPIRV